MKILRTELARARRHRIAKVVPIVGLLLIAVAGTVTFFGHESAVPDVARAEQSARSNEIDCRASLASDDYSATEIDDMCHQEASWYLVDERFHFQELMSQGSYSTWAEARVAASRMPFDSSYMDLPAGVSAPSETPAPGFRGGLPAIGMAMFLLAALVGASLIGADWRSKVIETQLTWTANRHRLMLAKVGAASIVSAAITAVLSAAFVIAHLPAAAFRGDFAGTGSRFFIDLVLVAGRITLGAFVVAALAASIAMLARSTVAGVGTVFVLGMVGTIAVGLAGRVSVVEFVRNFDAWIASSDVSREIELPMGSGGTLYADLPLHGMWVAGAVVVAYAGVAYVLGRSSFARRDIN